MTSDKGSYQPAWQTWYLGGLKAEAARVFSLVC